MNNKNSASYFNRASAYYNIKDYLKAQYDINMAIKLNPDYTKAYYRRAEINKALNDIPQYLIDKYIYTEKERNIKL